MKITIITLFPKWFENILSSSIIGRAEKKGLVEFQIVDLRPFGEGRHQVVDDKPFGGGVGMILKADILAKALKSVADKNSYVILTSASGKTFKQAQAANLSHQKDTVIICGHYEGVDQRFVDKYVTEEISIGDYILTGGEIPALAITDAVVRLIPGVLEKEEATKIESFSNSLLEYPQYTRPEDFDGEKVPAVLLSGHHQEIANWRQQQSLEKTKKNRPDLLK